MTLSEIIMLKKWIRSDSFWTSGVAYRGVLKLIPLVLDTWALMQSQYWPRERIERLQDARLAALFAAAQTIPLWRRVIRDAGGEGAPRDMLARIPVTTKNLMLFERIEDVVDMEMLATSKRDATSGSTGRPFRFFQDRHAILRSCAVTERIFRTATNGVRYPIVYMRSRERHGFTFYNHEWFYARGASSIRHRMDEFAELGRKYPDGFVVYGYTSWIAEVAREMERRNLRLPIRAVMVAGEHLRESDRALIGRSMQAELFTLYASREVGFVGFECERHKMHLAEEWALVEIVDEHGVALPAGTEGRIVVTAFDNRVMPFVRYDVGDRGVISDELCVCGRTLKTLVFKGREAEQIVVGERTVPLLDVASLLDISWGAIQQFQIVQTGTMSFTIRIIPTSLFAERKPRLESRLVRLLHPEAQIQWEYVEEIPAAESGKAVYFIRDFTS